ncbi:calpain-7-like [Branchiostoma floridae x Branchiostoma belcheri]
MDVSALELDAVSFASIAVRLDQEGNQDEAIFYYLEAAEALRNAGQAGSKMAVVEKAMEYLDRVEQLKQIRTGGGTFQMKTQQQIDLERARFLIEQAFEEDENDNKEEAAELYMEAVELCLKARKETTDGELQAKLGKLATDAIERAEQLKKKQATTQRGASPQRPATNRAIPPLGIAGLNLSDETPANRGSGGGSSGKKSPTGGGGKYTAEEIKVLRHTSNINGRSYVPFMSVDLKERFAFPVPFSDKHGKLALSPKQKTRFARWVRPDEFCSSPQMIMAISSFSIKQTVVSDCSFVASLGISAAYERRFKKKLITSIIYPQNKRGEPQYNPCGKYMVKLNINGVHRKVIIDDFLPVDQYGELLCSFSNNRNELWVSLLEKAYMKVMGGYDFPGSNSNIDLHALTGWIPERVPIREGSDDFNKNGVFNMMKSRFHKGECLITVATGEISKADEDRTGLVCTHAYALLDIREHKGLKMIQLKNPWSHLRWKGRYSEQDSDRWTPELQKAFNYDVKTAQSYDNGVFWIDYDSLCHFFDVIYINWNPEMFRFTTCMHDVWLAKEGPKKDLYSLGDNPQYRLEVKGPKGGAAVWVLLTRHITDKDDFAVNKEYITNLVYKTGGRKVFYPNDPRPYIDGVRINSPHYLCKISVKDPGTSLYTLVISQYEKSNNIYYTLRIYSTCEFNLTKVPEPYKHEKTVSGQWKGPSAGGCGNNPATYPNNPVFQFTLQNSANNNHVLLELKGPKQYSVGFDVKTVTLTGDAESPGAFQRAASGDFRHGYCVLELENVPGGTYNLTPCTFRAGQEGPFLLTVSSSCPFTVAQIK